MFKFTRKVAKCVDSMPSNSNSVLISGLEMNQQLKASENDLLSCSDLYSITQNIPFLKTCQNKM